MTDEEGRRHHYVEPSEEEKKALHELSLELARKFAEKDKNYVPGEEARQAIERLDKAYEERKKRPVEPPRQPAKYDFAPGVAPDGSLYPVHERKAATHAPTPQQHAEDHKWDGATLRTAYSPQEVAHRDQSAETARNGNWPHLLTLLDTEHVNRVRLGGTDGIAPLHQAAWHGAPVEVAQRLVELGAWRLLRTTAGQTPLAVAEQRGHRHLSDILQPVVRHPLADDVLRGLEEHLHLLIRGRAAELVFQWQLRLPQLAPITELTEPKLWFPVPGLNGGFAIELQDAELEVKSWSQTAESWARTHRVSRDSIRQV